MEPTGSPVLKYKRELEDSLLSGMLDAIEVFMEEEDGIPKEEEEDIENQELEKSTKFKDLINFFLSLKKDFDLLSPSSATLHFVVKHGDNESFLSLLKNKENLNVNSFTSKGTTLMHIVAMNGTCEMMQALLDRGANINICTGTFYEESFEENNNDNNNSFDKSEGYTPIHCAAFAGNLKMIEMLLNKGADVNAMSHYGTPLHFACGDINGNMNNDYLLKKKCFLSNEKIILGEDRTAVVEFLLERGADSELKDSNNKTALQRACFNGKLRIISVLLNHIAPV